MSYSLYGLALSMVQPFYDTLCPIGLGRPTNRVTPYDLSHTVRFESAHKMGHPIMWVAPWVRSVPTRLLII